MSDLLTPDLCVIGGGAAGLSVAAGAARLGVPVVLIEREVKNGIMGGECLHTGCIPSKTLIATASGIETVRTLSPTLPRIDWPAVRSHLQETISGIAPTDSAARFRALGVTVIEAAARFTGHNTVSAGNKVIRARRFVVATGSTPLTPKIPGLETVRWLSTDSIFELTEQPRHLLILGGGPVGLELAQAFRRFGSDVTVFEAGRVLAREDEELVDAVTSRLAQEGVAIRAGVEIVEVQPGPAGSVRLKTGRGEWIEGSHLLVAVGRAPRVENLGLERSGIEFDARGIKIRSDLRTTNRRVFAIGDVVDGPHFTHVGSHQAALILRKILFRLPVRFSATAMPRVTFTQPELAAVGLSEDTTRKRYRGIKVLRAPFSDIDRARTDGITTGHIKVMTTRRGKVLGASIVGEHAGELITPWTLAVSGKLTIRDMAQVVVPYPTLSEVSRKAAIDFYAEAFDRPLVRRILRWLRVFG